MIKKQNGTIVNIVSIAGKNGFQYGTTYASTKHAVMGFSKSLMLEVRKDNIRVIAICPGSVETEMIADSSIHKNMGQVLRADSPQMCPRGLKYLKKSGNRLGKLYKLAILDIGRSR